MATTKASAKTAKASDYKKMTPREHVLALPDTYVGSTETQKETAWVYDPTSQKMERRVIAYNPAFYKIFDEAIVNAADEVVRRSTHAERSQRVTQIDVTLTATQITVRNNGGGIPVEMHPEYKVMVPELIFGHLLTSSNYDKSEEKVVGGRNGYGAKLINIFSTEFIVRTCDGKNLYEQRFAENMTVVDPPTITAVKGVKARSFTEICYTPDLKQFFPSLPSEIPTDMLDVLQTRAFSIAGVIGRYGCRTFLNGTQIPVNSFESFVRLFIDEGAPTPPDGSFRSAHLLTPAPPLIEGPLSPDTSLSAPPLIEGTDTPTDTPPESAAPKETMKPQKRRKVPLFYEKCGDRWEIAAVPTDALHIGDDADSVGDNRHISFVNSIFTRRGGKHVDQVMNVVLTAFCKGPGEKWGLTPAKLKNALTFFVNATIVNPAFDSQTKDTLTTSVKMFGSVFAVSEAFVLKLAKEGGLLNEAKQVAELLHKKEAQKSDGRCVTRITGLPKLEDATLAGNTSDTGKRALIVTEGDSAKSLAMAGLSVVGRERFGVYPLKGKSLNVRDVDQEKINANAEFAALKKIIGLREGYNYTTLQGVGLRYNELWIMADQDVDGSHIKGLIINMFHSEWPSLLHLGFIKCLQTPLIKVTRGKVSHSFYSASEFEVWSSSNNGGKGWSIKYYKGLGTSTAAEARNYFRTLNLVNFVWDPAADETIDKVFSKCRSNDRKEWLTTYDRARVLDVPAGGADVSFTQFINDELIHFSNASNIRAIPSVMDGLKPSQRKILWAARKKGLKDEIKVAQLVGYVSEHAAYHHGEAALTGTIVAMAQDFVGSNNINLFTPNGQFGTRLQGGDDAAASRYIFTALAAIQATLFHKADDPALTWTQDDGQTVEPEYYLPTLPLLLINGSSGIGTGFSTDVPPFNPRDILATLRSRLTSEASRLTAEASAAEESEPLVPWWDGFRGTVTLEEKGKGVGKGSISAVTHGVFEILDDGTPRVHITELPVGTWTNDYKKHLEDLMEVPAPPKARAGIKKPTDAASVASGSTTSKKPTPAKPYLASYENDKTTDVSVDFMLTLDSEYFAKIREDPSDFIKRFKLTTSFSLANMVAFDGKGSLHRYGSVNEIMDEFFDRRLIGYGSRKANELARMNAEIEELDAKARFVQAVVDGSLVVSNAKDVDLLAGLKALSLPPYGSSHSVHPPNGSSDDADSLKAYDYLLRMRIDRLKQSSVLELRGELAAATAARDLLASKRPEDLWLEDLAIFESAYDKFQEARVEAREAADVVAPAAESGKKKRVARKPSKK